MDPLLKLAGEYDLKVIEDCAQAHGAWIRGRSADYADLRRLNISRKGAKHAKIKEIENRMGSCGTDEVDGEAGLIRRVGSFGDVAAFSFC
jgi:dTDP-4-amino-4,6-dideoxygalactose transaminase